MRGREQKAASILPCFPVICRTYSLLFDWMYPGNFRAVLCCLEAYADTPAVTTPLLKFVSEFVFNKSQRLTFDSSSPNGILLFREVSQTCLNCALCACVRVHEWPRTYVCLCVQQQPAADTVQE
jgi:hypothetical protein